MGRKRKYPDGAKIIPVLYPLPLVEQAEGDAEWYSQDLTVTMQDALSQYLRGRSSAVKEVARLIADNLLDQLDVQKARERAESINQSSGWNVLDGKGRLRVGLKLSPDEFEKAWALAAGWPRQTDTNSRMGHDPATGW